MRRHGGSERQAEKWSTALNATNETTALNAKLKKDIIIKHQNEKTALNAEMKRNGGSERQTKINIDERQIETMTLNSQLNW